MKTVRPVSSPWSVRWREFCQGAMPWCVFVGVGLAVAQLWNRSAGRMAIVGRVEAIHYSVSSPRAGQISTFGADLLQRVKKGEVLATILPLDLGAITARLNANVDLLKAQLTQSVDRNLIDFHQFRLEWMRNSVELSSSRIELQFAESNLERAGALFGTSIVSEAEFQLRKTRRDSLRDRVAALLKINQDLESEIERLRPETPQAESVSERAISAAIRAQNEELKAIEDSCALRAPVDAVVATINKRLGENLGAGEALMILGSVRPTRIVAFVRSPSGVQVTVGDRVEVTRRDAEHRVFEAKVQTVGAQLEPIDPVLVPIAPNQRAPEVGLPFLIELPSGADFAPGEVVNIRWLGKT